MTTGACGSYAVAPPSTCSSSSNQVQYAQAACIGRTSCVLTPTGGGWYSMFGDVCGGVGKTFSVQASPFSPHGAPHTRQSMLQPTHERRALLRTHQRTHQRMCVRACFRVNVSACVSARISACISACINLYENRAKGRRARLSRVGHLIQLRAVQVEPAFHKWDPVGTTSAPPVSSVPLRKLQRGSAATVHYRAGLALSKT